MRTQPFTIYLLVFTAVSLASAFVPHSAPFSNRKVPPMRNSATRALRMSDVPSNSDWKDSLPPSPEDQLIMTGDVVALFLYSFLDHSLNEEFVLASLRGDAATWDPFGEYSSAQIPVWFDALHSTQTQEYIMSIMNLPNIFYSPLISTAGVSSVLITTCWLATGWISGAFLFRNTLECSTSQALIKTFQTWLSTCAVMILLCAMTNHVFDVDGMMMITKADADYIFDSLTVLITWRFLVSLMLGYGK